VAKILGIDFGDRRTGFSISDDLCIIASPIGTFTASGMREVVDYTQSLVQKYNVSKIVLGLPLNMDGTEGERAEKSRKLAGVLNKVTGLEIVLKDERLTTVSALRVLDEASIKGDKRKNTVDTMSAQIILQSYLDAIKIKEN